MTYRLRPITQPRLGAFLCQLRKAKRVYQQAAADFIGVDKTQLSYLENGRGSPAFVTAIKLAKYYGISLDELAKYVD